MVDVSGKEPTRREAVAEALLRADERTLKALQEGALPKADPLPTARAAALLAVKATPGLIPHCHPIPLTDADVEFTLAADAIVVHCHVAATARTGVEMEALCGATIAALTLYDMLKALCPAAEIAHVRLLEKSGGKGGPWRREREDG
ncbi:MAG: molybdenum cofactor biosynthesis protein MoaC [Planctomycetes bacterium SM23_32]|nr:MAG: molybdenum cofactor biosynthesis protein MoaC [Planctomycetes bacterium SM23_32]